MDVDTVPETFPVSRCPSWPQPPRTNQFRPFRPIAAIAHDRGDRGHARSSCRSIQEYRGSYYAMRNRATVITRVTTREGIVGEAYAGDEDSTLAEIVGVVTRRDRAAADRPERLLVRALLGARVPGDATTSCATGGSGSSRSRVSISRSGTRSARLSGSRCGSSGAATATRSP